MSTVARSVAVPTYRRISQIDVGDPRIERGFCAAYTRAVSGVSGPAPEKTTTCGRSGQGRALISPPWHFGALSEICDPISSGIGETVDLYLRAR